MVSRPSPCACSATTRPPCSSSNGSKSSRQSRPHIIPGLHSHPAHALEKRQFEGYGGTFSIRLAGGEAAVAKLLGGVKLFTLAESLGGVESLIENPWGMTHTLMSEEARIAAGITTDLVRLSIGLEHSEDLIADLERALPT